MADNLILYTGEKNISSWSMRAFVALAAKELDFDDQNRHISYDVVPIIKATEASGYKGIYSIEFYTEKQPPRDVVAAAKTMIQTLAANIKA